MPQGNTIVRNVVQSSTDYDQFQFIDANRELARGHIETLKNAFEEVGNLTRVQPILVNDQYQIIDGQHRFIACKELGLPIYFTMVDGLGVREARSMNILHKNWDSDDFARSYALTGDTNYQTYLDLKDDYGFAHSILLYAINGTDIKGSFKGFREGNLVIGDLPTIRKRLDILASIGEHTSLVSNREFGQSIIRISETEGYDHKRMLTKLAAHADTLKRMGTMEDNIRQLEDVYNYKVAQRNRARFF